MIKFYIDTTGDVIGRFSAKKWADWINSFVVEKALITVNKHVSIGEELIWLGDIARKMKDGTLAMIIAIDEGKNAIAGTCEVRRDPLYGHNVSFGLAVHKNYRKQGIGKRLLKKGIEVAKDHFKAKNLWIEYIEGNEAAKKLYEKLGFVECCEMPNYVECYGEYRKIIRMAKLD